MLNFYVTIENQKRADDTIEKRTGVEDICKAAKLWTKSEKILTKGMDGEIN